VYRDGTHLSGDAANLAKTIGGIMSTDKNQGYEIIAKGELVMLRTHIETDRAYYQRWQTEGEWRSLDAPWAQNQADRKKQSPVEDEPAPQIMAVIATLENKPLGWVNRYSKGNSLIWFVGIDICENEFLNRGYGTEALRLWVDYLFANSKYHKLCLDTWSFNPRMARAAEKIGFRYEGAQREMQFWQGEWLDLLHYGMLREEGEPRR
jgi:RimJ/RimL family protein N-acetyltransferase